MQYLNQLVIANNCHLIYVVLEPCVYDLLGSSTHSRNPSFCLYSYNLSDESFWNVRPSVAFPVTDG